MSFFSKLFGRGSSRKAEGESAGRTTNEIHGIELTTCMACHKQTPLPQRDAPWGSALVCVNCHTPLIRPSDPDNPLSTSPERLEKFYGLRGRGLEHPRCPFCRKINYAIVFPARGLSLGWYVVPEPQNPTGFSFRVSCIHCNRDFCVEWDESPLKAVCLICGIQTREIAKKIPVIPFVYRALRNRYVLYQLKSKSTEDVFTDIYRSNAWGGKDSVSGTGSDVHQTRIITSELPALLNDLNISTMLDIPCGDFHWMKNVDLNGIDYTGADVVEEIIQKNREKYARNGVRFQYLNLIKNTLPRVDLVFCRDCLVHFSFADIFLALNNVCNSQSKYFLTTTFTGRQENHDIVTGQWRVLNLEIAPFVLPKPLKIINEGCTEGGGAFKDKALGLWRIADIRESLTRRST